MPNDDEKTHPILNSDNIDKAPDTVPDPPTRAPTVESLEWEDPDTLVMPIPQMSPQDNVAEENEGMPKYDETSVEQKSHKE
jgi:hypothetical protein